MAREIVRSVSLRKVARMTGRIPAALLDIVRPRINAPAWVGTLFVAVLGACCAVVSIAIGNSL